MIDNPFTPPLPPAGVLLCVLGGRHEGGTGLICPGLVLLVPDRHNTAVVLCRELSRLAGPRPQPPCCVVRITGQAAHEDILKLLHDLAAERHNLRTVAINRNGRYLIDVEVAATGQRRLPSAGRLAAAG